MIEQQNNYKGFVEKNLSNLTSPISGAASVSSSSKQSHVFSHQTHEQFHHSDDDDDNDDGDEHPPAKKKRNLPGNPDPESEVIALSPRTLQATNRFTCEICNKGFQRDQNLQLHRRGHNLPWKLKQRSKTEVVKKKVYVCPEQTCVHHHPSRALGDLTGIKKHFSRKHCDKKWKCDKCSKRYAVHSDWKAHSKVCGTREYRCDCGTLFSRRDSFITHRAFCDALAEETARAITTTTTISSSAALTINTHFMNDNNSDHHHLHATFPLKREQHHHLPPWLACPPIPSPSSSSSSIFQHQDQNPNTAGLLPAVTVSSSHMSATALLQKAAQMEATMSITSLHHHRNHHGYVADNNVPNTTCTLPGGMFGLDVSTSSSSFNHHDMYDGAFGVGNMGMKNPSSTFRQTPGGRGGGGGGEGMTRDFLGLKPLIQNDIFTLAALGNCMTSTNVVSTTTTTTSTHNHHQQETHKPWQS